MIEFTGKNCGIENWIEIIKDYTPKTELLQLDKKEYQVIRAFSYDKIVEIDPYTSCMYDRPHTGLTKEEEDKVLSLLANKIENILSGKKKFFKFNIFAPKDAGSCVIKSTKELFDTTFNSHRFFFDFPKLHQPGEPVYIAFREVKQIEEEYRVFLKGGKVIGISQYDDSDVIDHREPVKNIYNINQGSLLVIKDYVELISSHTGVTTAVVDIGIDINREMFIVELNPFSEYTNKSLLKKYDLYEDLTFDMVFAYAVNNSLVKFIEYKEGNKEERYLELFKTYEEAEKHRNSLIMNRFKLAVKNA